MISPLAPSGQKLLKLLWLTGRLILALVFIWAALEKILDPLGLAMTITGYQLAPAWLIAPAAIFMPWLELWAALATLTSHRALRLTGTLILTSLLVLFLAAVSYNLARGLDFDCGCFGAQSGQAGPKLIIQDSLLLLLAILILRKEAIKGSDTVSSTGEKDDTQRI